MNVNTKRRLYRLKWSPIDPTTESLMCRAYNDKDEPIEGFHINIDCKKLSTPNRLYAMLHGVKQTVGDEAAQSQGATLKQKFDAMRERVAHLESGSVDWTTGRSAGEGTLLYRALMEENPKRDAEKTRAIVAKMNERDKRALMNSERLRGIVDKLRGESGVDTNKLFEELDAE